MNRLRTIPGIVLLLLLAACATPATAPAATALPSETAVEATATMAAATETVQPDSENTTEVPVTGDAGTVVFNIVPQESKVTYEVGETFFSQNNRFALAIGTTGQISGSVTADLADPPASALGPIEVDISQFTSDSSRRDNFIRQNQLESGRFPIATFTSTHIEGLPTSYAEGQNYTFQVTGDLTVKEATQPVTFDVTARLEGNTLTGTATSAIKMSDFGVGPISLVGMLQTEDEVKLTFDFVARS
ncbi:MAG: YceI family protein [Chloroflexi bacterium]|nr:YceI family protein [Chloroflexota bacterium]